MFVRVLVTGATNRQKENKRRRGLGNHKRLAGRKSGDLPSTLVQHGTNNNSNHAKRGNNTDGGHTGGRKAGSGGNRGSAGDKQFRAVFNQATGKAVVGTANRSRCSAVCNRDEEGIESALLQTGTNAAPGAVLGLRAVVCRVWKTSFDVREAWTTDECALAIVDSASVRDKPATVAAVEEVVLRVARKLVRFRVADGVLARAGDDFRARRGGSHWTGCGCRCWSGRHAGSGAGSRSRRRSRGRHRSRYSSGGGRGAWGRETAEHGQATNKLVRHRAYSCWRACRERTPLSAVALPQLVGACLAAPLAGLRAWTFSVHPLQRGNSQDQSCKHFGW
ncbi:hypothetical protein BJ741DRAFT_609373 [Chytriomyces cf. hyalinus JEL632]|nr:hypothetical protein BJ741DRAFT_609373 [Chytriomyces cf. hyalinus JEL632]